MKQPSIPRSLIVISIMVVLIILVATPVLTAEIIHIDRYVIGSGGGTATSGIYTLNGTIGQPVTGLSSSGDFNLCSGFWCKFLEQFNVFIPMVLRNK